MWRKAKWFYVARDYETQELFIIQSDLDENRFWQNVIGPFFSVQEATRMLLTWG